MSVTVDTASKLRFRNRRLSVNTNNWNPGLSQFNLEDNRFCPESRPVFGGQSYKLFHSHKIDITPNIFFSNLPFVTHSTVPSLSRMQCKYFCWVIAGYFCVCIMCEGSHTVVAREVRAERTKAWEGGREGAKKSASPKQLNNLSFYTWLSWELYILSTPRCPIQSLRETCRKFCMGQREVLALHNFSVLSWPPLVALCDVLSKIEKKNASTFCCYLILIRYKITVVYRESVNLMAYITFFNLPFYNNPSHPRILIGSCLLSIRGQTHDWRHHYKVLPSAVLKWRKDLRI